MCAEKAQLPTRGEYHLLVESVWELRYKIEPLMTFTDEEVLEDLQLSNWVTITPSKLMEPTPRECSRS